MDRLPQDTLHAMLLAAAMGSLAVVLRIVVARTHGRNWFTETLAGVAVLTVMAVLVLLVLGGRQ